MLIVSCIFLGAYAAPAFNDNPISKQRNTAEDASPSDGDGCPRAYSLTIPEAAVKTHNNGDKLIIAHRGASFHLPEHTLAAYRLALEMGADFVEPDLVATKDGHLIALHTADLSVTTNVEEVFGMGGTRRDLQEESVDNATASQPEGSNSTPSGQTPQQQTTQTQTTTTGRREPWFSPFANRTGYWSFNFTLAEIQTLRVKQRLPRARTTAYDGMFSVPTFLEIQQLVQNWNQERVPQLLLHVDEDGETDTTATAAEPASGNATAHTHYQQTAGVYAELKSTPWFEKDANINLVDLLLQEIDDNADLFQSVLKCPDIFRFDEYTVPPLVIQSFEGEALQDLTEKWKAHPSPNIQQAPLPPMILLISQYNCWEESFWFQVGETWRKYVQGVGMDKACFPKVGSADDKGHMNVVEEGQSAKERAEEFNLVIHAYTERPEHEFLMEGFQNGLEETQYLLCTIGAQAVFSESVHTGILAARMGCPTTEATIGGDGEDEDGSVESSSGGKSNQEPSGGSSASKNLCWENSSEANLYVGLASFSMGVIVVILLSMWAKRGITGRRPPRQQQVPSEDQDEASGGVELPPDDELL